MFITVSEDITLSAVNDTAGRNFAVGSSA